MKTNQKLILTSSLVFIFSLQFSAAQIVKNKNLVNSTTGIAGKSITVTQNNQKFDVQQMIGQSSPIGTFEGGRYLVSQGFIQPILMKKIMDKSSSLSLDVTFFPNPFVESTHLIFKENINGPVEVALYDMVGRLLFNETYEGEKAVKVDFNNLFLGKYILKVKANNKQFIKNIIKK